MDYLAIQGTPVLVNAFFVEKDSAPPPSSHPITGLLLSIVETLLPSGEASALQCVVSTPLDQSLNKSWVSNQSVVTSTLQSILVKQRPNAYKIAVNVPPSGTLGAAVVDVIPPALAGRLPPGTTGQGLILNFVVSGLRLSWSERTSTFFGSSFDPSYNGSLDITITTTIAIPVQPNIAWVSAIVGQATNIHASTGNLWAVVSAVVNNIGLAVTDIALVVFGGLFGLAGAATGAAAALDGYLASQGVSLPDQLVSPPIPDPLAQVSAAFATTRSLVQRFHETTPMPLPH